MKIDESIKKLRVLVVPLNWGLGHATRLIPVIRELVKMDVDVLIGGSPQHLAMFRQETGNLETVDLPCLNVRLSGRKIQFFSILLQLPAFFIQIAKEHLALKKLIRRKQIDIVISDNCYGLWNHSVHSVFITHQLMIKLPEAVKFLEKTVNRINSNFIHKFDECWIPDVPDEGGFAGELSHSVQKNIKVKYIGILSRFAGVRNYQQASGITGIRQILFIISGPERQRTTFENIIKREVLQIPDEYNYTVIRGLTSKKKHINGSWISFANADKMVRLINSADIIICRAGYSTIMDLLALGKTAVLVPTPGQTEQEYLAGYLAEKKYFCQCRQDRFRIESVIRDYEKQHLNQAPKIHHEKILEALLKELMGTRGAKRQLLKA